MTSGRDWMFCPTTGALLKVDDLTGEATCPLSGWSRSLEGIGGVLYDNSCLLPSDCYPELHSSQHFAHRVLLRCRHEWVQSGQQDKHGGKPNGTVL